MINNSNSYFNSIMNLCEESRKLSADKDNKQENVQKFQIKELSESFDDLSNFYLTNSLIERAHAYKSLSQRVKKIDPTNYNKIFLKMTSLIKMNTEIWLVKEKLNEIKNEQEFINLIKYIDDFEGLHVKNFTDYVDKDLDKETIQLIDSLYLYELNGLKKDLKIAKKQIEIQKKPIISTTESTINPVPLSYPSLKDKKVLIFTCSFGTGHKVTAGAVKDAIKPTQAEVEIYDLSTGALLGQDRYRIISKIIGLKYGDKLLSGVDIFNEVLKRQWYSVINAKHTVDLTLRKWLHIKGKDGVAPATSLFVNNWGKEQIRQILMSERPDHIVTTYHMDLNPILEVAQEMKIPILHIPTDYDMKCWEVFDTKSPEYPLFKSLIPNENVERTYESRAPLTEKNLVKGVGIPLRAEFYNSLSEEEQIAYKQQKGISDDEKVLYLSSGGNGQKLPHPELLANSPTWNTPLRLQVIVGKNREFAKHLQTNLQSVEGNPYLLCGSNPFVKIEIIVNSDPEKKGTEEEFFINASEISKILDISDGSIAKSGGLSVSELLFKGVPILFDQRVKPFIWELFNVDVTLDKGRGLSSFNVKDLEDDLNALFQIPKEKNEHFYFENSREILCHTIAKQIEEAQELEAQRP